MAAAIAATNKWLLTKQVSVALSGLWDDRHGAGQREESCRRRRRQERGAKLWTAAPQTGRPSQRCTETIPGGKGKDTPTRNPQESVNRRRMRANMGRDAECVWKGGSKQHGEVSATAWSVLSAVGQLSALLSSLGFMSDTIYLAVKPLQPSHSPLSLFLPLSPCL